MEPINLHNNDYAAGATTTYYAIFGTFHEEENGMHNFHQRFTIWKIGKSHIPDNIGVIELFELFQQGNFSKNGHRNAVLR